MISKIKGLILAAFLLFQFNLNAQNNCGHLRLWYNKPATAWEEALPLGNGKTGAMVFGGVVKERYQLNDNTLWSGYPNAGDNSNGPEVLPKVREAIWAGKYNEAAILWKKVQGPYSARYLPLADLNLDLQLSDSVATSYYRELDLRTAVVTVKYCIKGVNYTRETLISHPDKVMLIRITADEPGMINFSAALSSKLKYAVAAKSGNQLILTGKAPKYVANRDYEPRQIVYDDDNGEGMTFAVNLKIKTAGGNCTTNNENLVVKNATTAEIYLTEETSFNGFNKSAAFEGKDSKTFAGKAMDAAFAKAYNQLKLAHVQDYAQLFNRVNFNLESKPINRPTNLRLKNFQANKSDVGLQVLYYQYGRYLMIAASRVGSRPTNLQGIWNDQVQPAWGSNYTTNINTEMNYWLAENTNLSELHQPLFNFIKELAVNGGKTAKTNYGISEGWLAHHNSDLWAKTSPTGGYDWDVKGMPRWSAWPMAGAWLSTHLWEHYIYTGDKAFLKKEAYPLMKGAAQFMLAWLVKDPQSGYLVTNPSTSPENTVKIGKQEYQLSMASTMDMSIIRELFSQCISAAKVLDTDNEFVDRLERAVLKLYPFHIGRYGQIQEWFQDWDDPQDTHRHISHLFSLYPGSQISVYTTPQLAAAAKQTLIHRGDMSTGWSMAWKINWWARLKDGEHAYKILESAFTYIDPLEKREQMGGGGTYPNLFDAHPPFQIDGNFGGTAGITEMLLQSHEDAIHLLPALPRAWPQGTVSGIRARGNFDVAISWKNHKLTTASITARSGGNCRLRTAVPIKITGVKAHAANGKNNNKLVFTLPQPDVIINPAAKLQPLNLAKTYVTEFEAVAGKTYQIKAL